MCISISFLLKYFGVSCEEIKYSMQFLTWVRDKVSISTNKSKANEQTTATKAKKKMKKMYHREAKKSTQQNTETDLNMKWK